MSHFARFGAVLGAAFLMVSHGACTVFNGLTVPDPGEGGTGQGGTGGSGGSTGAGGTGVGGTPSFSSAFLTVEEAVRVCRWARPAECPLLAESVAVSLGLPIIGDGFASCVDWLAGPVPPSRPGQAAAKALLSCVAAASSCDEAKACSFVELLDPLDERCAGQIGQPATCADANTVLNCEYFFLNRCNSDRYVTDSTCEIGVSGAANCSFGPCDNQASLCLGDTLFACADDLLIGYDCSSVGLFCGTQLFCAATDQELPKPCSDPPGTPTCNGTKAVICDGQLLSYFECAELGDGAACEQIQGVGRCVMADATCSPRDLDGAACVDGPGGPGTALPLCVAGQRFDFDCAAAGLSCQSGACLPP